MTTALLPSARAGSSVLLLLHGLGTDRADFTRADRFLVLPCAGHAAHAHVPEQVAAFVRTTAARAA
jgi:predicted esterase